MPSLRLGLSTTAAYFAVIGLATVYAFALVDPPRTTMEMLWRLLPVQVLLVGALIYGVTRHLTWAAVGFGRLRWRALIWLSPSIALMLLMIHDLRPALSQTPISGLWLLLLVPFLIGFSEEVMFRGVLLRGAMARLSVGQAMLLSAVLFALLHVLNGIVVQAMGPALQQTAFAFFVGFFLAPIALKLGNLWPVILWHGLWDLIIFVSQIAGVIHPLTLFGILMQAVICIWLWADLARAETG